MARKASPEGDDAKLMPPAPAAAVDTVQVSNDAAAPLQSTLAPTSDAPASAPPPMPADWRYTINAEIARGGMGRVVDATDTVLGRTVALKEVLSLDPDTVRRFQRETRITARLEHPSIVPVHDAGTSPNGAPFYVMRKVSGRPLEELVARGNHLTERLALVPQIVAAAHAVAHAHERGIVHRDIKPANILVGDAGETIVIDWGLAKTIGEAEDPHAPVQRVIEPDETLKTRAGIVFGTPGFMAPEQLRGRPVDERCDVYALGATLYHLLARRPPHYSKNADTMMKAAVHGPPQPLSEIVDGVPPELATIVDKALAHDATQRYQNAGALAEDLQRFLTGQVVASHYYTPRERFMRFLRKHRVTLAIASGLLLALAIVAFVLVQRIRDERDRADEQAHIAVAEKKIAEQEREKAFRNSRELALGNARHAATTDPTRATALAKPLVDSELWRHARDVGAAASVNGIAFSLAASPHTLALELSRDGQRALAAGDDGIVRIFDLAKRDSRIIANTGGAVMARFADGERKLVLWQGNRLTLVDVASGAKREVTAPTAIAKLEVSGPIAFWVDPANAVWKLDLAAGAPVRVETSEPVVAVAPSPDGRWIALAGRQHLMLVDRSSSTLPPEVVTDGEAKSMTWAADAPHLVVLFKDEVIDVSLQPSPHIVRRLLVGDLTGIAYSDGRIFSSGPTGVELVLKDGTKMRAPGGDHTLGVFEARERVVIAAKPQGEVVVLSDLGDHNLISPLPLAAVATSATGPWIVAATSDRLLVWNLDALEPREVARGRASSAHFVTGDHVIATFGEDTAVWIDLHTRKSIPLGELQSIDSVVAAPDGAEAVIIDGQRRAHRVAGVGQPQELEGEVSAAAFVGNLRLVLAVPGGLRIDDQQQHTKLALFAHDPEARGLVATGAGGGWVVAAFADGLIWRKHLASAHTSELRVAPLTSRIPIALADDGTVVLGANGEVRTWRSDGTSATVAKDLTPIHALALADAWTAIVLTDDGAQVVDLRHAGRGPPMPAAKNASLAGEQGLVATTTATGEVEIVDPLTNWHWTLASPQKGLTYTFVEIAPDGSRVVAATEASVVVWTLGLPETADQTKRWLDTITNATADTPSGPLGWQ